ncbi:MAG: Ig-like domain-containing protein [Coriobacteriia bacterium]|nr:Ig-like domain-containing protein [Coriobacteriia bacterium]MCL2870040.1 Ig-like domain-containing protein [Coriobacteriia bacterium]
MIKRPFPSQKVKKGTLSARKKTLIVFAAILLLALPVFAVASPDAVRSFVAQIQQSLTGEDQATVQPLFIEEGSAALNADEQRVIQAASGRWHNLALRDDGTLWSWGRNPLGQLGLGDTIDRNVPSQIKVPDVTSWSYVAAGTYASFAIATDGTLWSWGSGPLALGTWERQTIPQQITGGADSWQSLSTGGNHVLAIATDGTLWSWGSNARGEAGQGTNGLVSQTPTQITAGAAQWKAASAGVNHSLAIDIDGNLWSWGGNGRNDNALGVQGQLGLGLTSAVSRNTPQRITTGASSWLSVAANDHASYAVGTDGTLWAWGNNAGGRLGIGTGPNQISPVQITEGAALWQSVFASSNPGAANHVLAIDANGNLWSWGSNTRGQLGLGSTVPSSHSTPQQITTGATAWLSASLIEQGSLAVDTNGAAWTWGTTPWRIAASAAPANASTRNPSNDATAPNNNAVNVSLDTETITIRFDREMRTDVASLGAITLDNGATVDVSAGVWSGGTHPGALPEGTEIPNSVFTAPFNLTAFDTLHTATVEGFIDAQFGVRGTNEMYPHTWSFTTAPAPLSVVSVAPAGNRVPVDTGLITITFSEPVASGNGRTIHMTGEGLSWTFDYPSVGVWNDSRTVLTLPMPTEHIEHSTTYTIAISGFVAVTGGAMTGSYAHIFRTAPMAQSGLFTKTLEVPEGTTIPSPSFDFNFVPRQVALDDNPTVESRPTSEFENLIAGPQTIGLDASEATTASGTITLVGELDLWALLDNLSFPSAGVFVWDVYEVAGSSGTASPSYMTYDSTRFQIRAWVTYDGLEFIAIHELSYAEGSWTAGEKIDDGIDFLNSYRRIVGSTVDPNNNALEVSKSTLGEFADLSTLFEFTLTLRAHVLAPITDTALGGESGDPAGVPPHLFVPRIVDHAGNPVSRTVAIVGDGSAFTLSFQLAHGEKLVIPTLPAGTTFNVVEAAHADFAPSVNVYAGGSRIHSVVGTPGTSLGSEDRTLTDAGRNAADFTNTHQFSPPAGLVIANGYFFILALVALLIVALLMARRRKTIEQMPLN